MRFLKHTVLAVVLYIPALTFWAEFVAWKMQPRDPTADQRYGCTVAQQAPNGECK